MKKITTLFILALIFISGLFAQTKIPYEGWKDNVKPYLYTSPDGSASYKIRASIQAHDEVSLSFIKYFLSTNTRTSISIIFDNKDVYDKFTKDFDLSEIETEFTNLQKKIIKSGVEPRLTQQQNNNSNILEVDNIDPTKPYNTWYNCYCMKNLQITDAKNK